MLLKNKKTGEIIDFDSITDLCFGRKIQLQATNRYNKPIYIYNSLAELNAEWEDFDSFVIDPGNEDTTLYQLRACIKDALEVLEERIAELERKTK